METDFDPIRSEREAEGIATGAVSLAALSGNSASGTPPADRRAILPASPAPRSNSFGWTIPVSISLCPEEARTKILLPRFSSDLLEKAQALSDYFPFAATECRSVRYEEKRDSDVPRFETVFRIAAKIAHVPVSEDEYDELLIVTAWRCVRPHEEGFLGSYPKSLLCPLSHTATPEALTALPAARRFVFNRRAPVYLRYLLSERLGQRTCADLENADLRQMLRSAGFRLIRPSAVPEFAFPGCTRGEDPPVRPWKLILRQELTDDRAAEMLVEAAMWQVRYGLRLVTLENGTPRWNIGAFSRVDWEDAFLSLGVRVPPALTRESGLLDWRALLERCIEGIGAGNLPPELLGKLLASPRRASHDNQEAIWTVLDRVSAKVLELVRAAEPHLFSDAGVLLYREARSYRRWARIFDEVSPNVLSRFGVSAYTALRRVAPQWFGLGPGQLKPWELEQEHGKWKGPRGRALLKSAYAFALHEAGLGAIEYHDEDVLWRCTRRQFSEWSALQEQKQNPFDFLYRLASRHGLTPLLNREVSHTGVISLLAGVNLHDKLPRMEGCWTMCMRAAFSRHAGVLEVPLAVPDMAPLPLRLRKAALAPLEFTYVHREVRFVREFDLRMARESHRKLEEIPGWWDDDRIVGTPLAQRMNDPADPARAIVRVLHGDPWLEHHKVRFRALHLLLSRTATTREGAEAALGNEEIRALLKLALDAVEHTNVVRVSLPAVRRGFERIVAREDIREMLDSLLLHVGTAYETERWGQVRKFIALDVVNDLLALVMRGAISHLAEAEIDNS